MKKRVLAWTVLAAALGTVPALAQTKTGTTIGQFLLIEPSARVAAMGNAGVSLYDGLEGVYYNPAAIGRLTGYGVTFSHLAWVADITYDYAAAGIPLGKWGTGYASVTALNSGEMDVRTVAQPLGTGERFSVSDIALGLGYGRQITSRFAAGLQLNWLQETIWHSSASTVTFNVGTLYRISDRGLHLGASLSNFGTQGRFDGRDLRILYDQDPNRYGDNGSLPGALVTDPFQLPSLFRVGVGYPLRLNEEVRLHLALDAFHPGDNSESVSAGAELKFRELLAVRAGYQNAFVTGSEVGLTFGGGLQGVYDVYHYHFDYAWADQGRLGSSHRFTLGLSF